MLKTILEYIHIQVNQKKNLLRMYVDLFHHNVLPPFKLVEILKPDEIFPCGVQE